ncbi:MAG: alpha/beta fold hydrolase [Chlorobia bacterium]|nr:alpha/beta fold hydrolase [Fimbriimonadaceae bacterium]
MTVVDLPLDQLRTYQGRNPRPDDFDEYWARALADLAAQPDDVELIPAAFACSIADCFDLWFTGVGGSRVHAKYLRPRIDKKGPGALMFHGYSWHSGDWNDKLALVSEGFSVMALDCRGQGGPSQELGGYGGTTFYGHIIRGVDDPDPDKLLYRQMLLDTAQLARILTAMPEVDPDRLVSIGGSQGGALALACAALEPRIKKCAPMYPFLCDFKRVWEMDSGTGAYQAIRDWFRMFDPRHEREDWFFTKMGYIDIQNLMPRVNADVLMACGLMDMLCPASSQFAAYNKITSKKEIVIYPDHGHEGLPGFGDLTFEFVRGV